MLQSCIGVIIDFERGYQSRSSLANVENVDLLAEFHSMLSRSVTECNCTGLMILSRLKYLQLSH
jgi:hypothetical protein